MPDHDNAYNRLLNLLNQGHELSGSDAAALLGVTVRTIQRAIGNAMRSGVVIEIRRKGREKVFFIPEEHRETGLVVSLDQNELLALVVAAEAAHGTLARTPLGGPLKQAIGKLIERMPEEFVPIEAEESDLYWHFSSSPASEVDPDIFRQLVDAIRDCAVILVDYQSASGSPSPRERTLSPYAMAVQGGSWLLVAWCHRNNAFRDFSIPAIARVVRTGGLFVRREDFDLDDHFRGRFRAVGGRDVYTVRFRVESDRVPYFKRKRYHPSQKLEEQPDGSWIAAFTVSGLEDIRSFAQSWGVGITVLEPPELVAVMAEQASRLARVYSRTAADEQP